MKRHTVSGVWVRVGGNARPTLVGCEVGRCAHLLLLNVAVLDPIPICDPMVGVLPQQRLWGLSCSHPRFPRRCRGGAIGAYWDRRDGCGGRGGELREPVVALDEMGRVKNGARDEHTTLFDAWCLHLASFAVTGMEGHHECGGFSSSHILGVDEKKKPIHRQ